MWGLGRWLEVWWAPPHLRRAVRVRFWFTKMLRKSCLWLDSKHSTFLLLKCVNFMYAVKWKHSQLVCWRPKLFQSGLKGVHKKLPGLIGEICFSVDTLYRGHLVSTLWCKWSEGKKFFFFFFSWLSSFYNDLGSFSNNQSMTCNISLILFVLFKSNMVSAMEYLYLFFLLTKL